MQIQTADYPGKSGFHRPLKRKHRKAAIFVKPVDIEYLLEATSNNPETLTRLVSLYIHHTGERLEGIKAAIALGDPEGVYSLAHTALGSSLTCGMTAIIPSLRELERMGTEIDLRGAESELTNALTAFEAIRNYLKEKIA
jgi:HPt (histidine-containing phosphotransfer) domain-containing protein